MRFRNCIILHCGRRGGATWDGAIVVKKRVAIDTIDELIGSLERKRKQSLDECASFARAIDYLILAATWIDPTEGATARLMRER